MSITLSANYSKKLGLPKFSSHSFSASVEVELTDLTQVESECQRLYVLLQQTVDREIQEPGFVPGDRPTIRNRTTNENGSSARANGDRNNHHNGSNGHHPSGNGNGSNDRWSCTEGQRGFILRIVNENSLSISETEALASQLFDVEVRQLNKMQASQFIDELLTKAGKPRQTRWQRRTIQALQPAIAS